MLNNLPQGMRELPQWICYRNEIKDNGKVTKIPYCPQLGTLARVNDSSTWTTFEKACELAPDYDGVGFVFSASDPFCFIDFDTHDGAGNPYPQKVYDEQSRIVEAIDSYKEVSPGGGLHIYCRASVPSGRKLSKLGIEIYSSNRFSTITGNVYGSQYRATTQQARASEIWEYIGDQQNNVAVQYDGSAPQDFDDMAIYNMAASAKNGEKFVNLWNGNWNFYYSSQSEADFALCNILAFYSASKNQVRNMFWQSALGRREKAKRSSYLEPMLTRAYDRAIPTINFDFLYNEMQQVLAEANASVQQPVIQQVSNPEPIYFEPPKPVFETPVAVSDWDDADIPRPPGLMGLIADFTLRSSPHPQPKIAVATAISLMSGVCGKAFNIHGSGLNHYLLVLAETGIGKNAIQTTCNRLTNTYAQMWPQVGSFIGARDFSSGPAVTRYLSEHATRSYVSIVGEFGSMLKKLSDEDFGANVSLRNIMLDLFTSSGRNGMLRGSAYSDSAKNIDDIQSPAVSLIGDSQPSTFYKGMTEQTILSGLVPRFLIFEYDGLQCYENFDAKNAEIDEALSKQLQGMFHIALSHLNNGIIVDVQENPQAEDMMKTYSRFCTDKRNSGNDISRNLWVRAKMKVYKLAALAAVGLNPQFPVLTPECIEWAQKIVETDILNLSRRFHDGSMGGDSEEGKQTAYCRERIIKYLSTPYVQLADDKGIRITEELWMHRVIPYNFISRTARNQAVFKRSKIGSTNAIKRALQALVDDGDLVRISKNEAAAKFGVSSDCFAIMGEDLLTRARAAFRA